MENIIQYPILFLNTKHLTDIRIQALPHTVRHVFLPTHKPLLDPDMIKKKPEIIFYISCFALNNQDYNLHNYHQPNLKILTTNRCHVTFNNYHKYISFSFSRICWSHLKGKIHQKVIILKAYKPDEIFLDSSNDPLTLSELVGLQSITYIATKTINHYKTRHRSDLIFSLEQFKIFKRLRYIEFQVGDRISYTDFKLMGLSMSNIIIYKHSTNIAVLGRSLKFKVNWNTLNRASRSILLQAWDQR